MDVGIHRSCLPGLLETGCVLKSSGSGYLVSDNTLTVQTFHLPGTCPSDLISSNCWHPDLRALQSHGWQTSARASKIEVHWWILHTEGTGTMLTQLTKERI